MKAACFDMTNFQKALFKLWRGHNFTIKFNHRKMPKAWGECFVFKVWELVKLIVFHGALKPALKNKQTEATKFSHFVPKRTNKRIPCQKYLTCKFVSPVCQRKIEDGLKRCWISCLAFVSRQKSDEPILDNSQVSSAGPGDSDKEGKQ